MSRFHPTELVNAALVADTSIASANGNQTVSIGSPPASPRHVDSLGPSL
jgi:hypothetical protein